MNSLQGADFRAGDSLCYSQKTKNFVTIFPRAENVHLHKDVGQIPQVFAKEFGFNSLLLTDSGAHCADLATGASAFRVVNLRKSRLGRSANMATFYHLWRNASRIDVLNLYHLSLETKALSILYKWLNPGGFTYIKLDVNVQDEKAALQRTARRAGIRRYLGTRFHQAFFRSVNVFSAESAEGVAVVSQRYPMMSGKVVEVPNGIEVSDLDQDVGSIVSRKEDLIITVGRIGSPEKNNELFLRAVARIDLKHWKVAMVGPFTPEFEALFNSVIEQSPNLKGRVKLVGNVADRKTLMNWYSRAKIFVMTSRFEGFPLVFPEAQCHGDYIVSTNVSSVAEITKNLRYGRIADSDEDAVASVIAEVIANGVCSAELASEIMLHAREKYDWKNALSPVHERIVGHLHV